MRANQGSPYPKMEASFVPLGDVAPLGDSSAGDMTMPYGIEKYIKINGTKYAPNIALGKIRSNDSNLRISDVYPGSLELVYR